MKVRLWPVSQRVPELDSIESRFPSGTRSGEGTESLRPFLESARRLRVQSFPGLPSAQRRRLGSDSED